LRRSWSLIGLRLTGPQPIEYFTAGGTLDCGVLRLSADNFCLHDGVGDYDCAGGAGNGPNYVEGPIRVLAPDPFDLDRDGNGLGCES